MILTAAFLLAPLAVPFQEAEPTPQPASQPAAEPAPAPAPPQVVFSMGCEGLDAFLVDRKDAALLRALKMFDERLLELPAEVPDFQAPPQVLGLVTRLFARGHSLTVALSQEPIPGMPMPFMVDLRLAQGSDGSATEVTDELVQFIGQMGMELTPPAADKLYVLPVPVQMWMGARGDDFVLRVGSDAGVEVPSPVRLLPADTRLSYYGGMDYGLFLKQAFKIAEMAGEMDEDSMQMAEMLRSIGLDELNYEWAAGSDAERQHFVMRMEGWATKMREMGLMAEHNLSDEFLSKIPADVTWASAVAFDLEGVFNFYVELLAGYELDVISEIEGALGLSIRDELIAPLGGQLMVYASETTGGGGILSTVGVLELADREQFLATWQKLEDAVDQLGAAEVKGYVRFETWGSDEASFHSLTFPGLPIPLELTLGTIDNYAVIGASPQSVQAAMDQIASPTSSLFDVPGFRDQAGAKPEDLVGLIWIDTPRLMRDGYGTVSLLTGALANVMRSPSDTSRNPGILMPSYSELAAGAKGIVGLSFARNGDYITEYRADRSQLVNAAGLTGFFYNSPVMALIGLGAAAGAASGTRVDQGQEFDFSDDADYEQVDADIRELEAALEAYALANGGRYPTSLEVLVTPDENGQTFLGRTSLPLDPWGDDYDYWIPSDEGRTPHVESPNVYVFDGDSQFIDEEVEVEEAPAHDHEHEAPHDHEHDSEHESHDE